ncbi:MAG: signal peptidase I [Planctomycetota bacterium]|nr:signal peptidase I [Planctomycetota bacterium]
MPDQPAPDANEKEDGPAVTHPKQASTERLAEEIRGWLKSLFFALVLVLIFRAHVAEGYQIKGASMEPTLKHSDRLFVEKLTHHFRQYRFGDIVVFPHPVESKKLIKRVVATAGQQVEIRQGVVYVDGEFVEEIFIDENNRDQRDYSEDIVPEGMLFVLGDNRKSSNDSRSRILGFIDEEAVVGRAFFRFWPLGRFRVFP